MEYGFSHCSVYKDLYDDKLEKVKVSLGVSEEVKVEYKGEFSYLSTTGENVNEITKKTGIDKQTVLTTVEAFMDAVKDSLSNDENVYLRGFGSFVVKKRAQKTARNISKNTTIIIPEHNIPAFKPAKTFTISVKK